VTCHHFGAWRLDVTLTSESVDFESWPRQMAATKATTARPTPSYGPTKKSHQLIYFLLLIQ
jgi:hypothetical protein